MKRENIRLAIFFVITALVGCGLHFLYEWSPNLLFAVLSPVRESVWEHLKLLFWPMLCASLLYTRKTRQLRAAWYLGLLVSSVLLLVYGWACNIRMAQANVPIDIAAFVLILALGFVVAAWVQVAPRWQGALLMAVGVLGLLIVIFTFLQPKGLLFADLELVDALYTLPC